jgi:periplasmic protein CpxP/Spy
MKLSKMGLLAALTLGGLVVCSNMALAQDAKDGKKGGKGRPTVEQQMERMTEQLTLTDAQKPKVKAVLEESQKKRQEMFNDSSVPQDQRREKMQALMKDQDAKLKGILTTEQYDKWQKAREEMRGKKGGDKQGEGKKKA